MENTKQHKEGNKKHPHPLLFPLAYFSLKMNLGTPGTFLPSEGRWLPLQAASTPHLQMKPLVCGWLRNVPGLSLAF